MSYSGVTPVFKLRFHIKDGQTSYTVKDVESLSITFDNGIEEWTAMDSNGWRKRLMTGKALSVGMSGKRCFGDPGNDFVASLAFKTGLEAQKELLIEFPDGAQLSVTGVVNVTSMGGESTQVASLDWEVLSVGEPVFTEESNEYYDQQ